MKVTLLVTSCGRFDLLKRTLDSFFSLNTYPIEKVILNEDSGIDVPTSGITYNFFKIIKSNKEGQAKALDRLLTECKTEYYFSLEDDWEFKGNKDFILHSLKIMQDESINHVWVRERFDHAHPLGEAKFINGVLCYPVLKRFQEHWGGFSHNPGLKRLSDYKRIFPNGYQEYGDEIECSKRAEKMGYKAVALVDSACKHIGYNRHTPDFKI